MMLAIPFAIFLGDVVLGAVPKETSLCLVQLDFRNMLDHSQLLQNIQDVQFSHHPFPTNLIEFLSFSLSFTLEAVRLK